MKYFTKLAGAKHIDTANKLYQERRLASGAINKLLGKRSLSEMDLADFHEISRIHNKTTNKLKNYISTNKSQLPNT